MEVTQLMIDWEKRDRDLEVLADHLMQLEMEDSDVGLLLVVAREDRERAQTTYARKSKKEWALAIGASRNTPVAAMRRLAARGVLAWSARRSGHEVLVDWSEVWKLEPTADARGRLAEDLETAKSAAGQGVVRAGEGCARVLVRESKARGNRVPVSSSAPRGLDDRLVRPWSVRGGLTGEDLRWAVARRSKAVLQRLYWQAVESNWWEDCEDYRVRFLALAHHAATAGNAPMALLTSLCRSDADGRVLRSSRIRDASRDWAAETRRGWQRENDPVIAEADAERRREWANCE